ncbi:hypothetical protein [Alicyclobacillus sp. SO9]|uniref:hypothetical protein n=1 Tax=Alicyclobacillus sp. SO9 TaxID=2665646 RepID=UPI0018E7A5D9|nr:hypothetical protein [Alicyclobacillus sp. SO9]QQE77797.1 hypothetical protein GI364_17985 [Alicyclobacillus sp. SO9]
MANQNAAKKRLSPTVIYILTGLIAALPGLLLSTFALHSWRDGTTLTPDSLMAIHLTILGFMLTVAFGVLYQIVPIAFQASPLPRHVYQWHLPAHLFAVAGMVVGFGLTRYLWVGIFGSVLVAFACAYLWFVLRSYRHARNKTHVHRQLAWPFLSFIGVTTLGLYQAFVASQVTQPVLLSHVVLGGIGMWGGLVIAVSYKLVPMFSLSHGYHARLPYVTGFYYSAVVCYLLAQITGNHLLLVLGILATGVAVVGFSSDIVRILRARKRKRIVLPLKEALLALAISLGALCLVLIGWSIGRTHTALVGAYLFTFAGLIPMMMAYIQKMIPFLWFEYRFSKSKDRKTAPLIDEMISKPVATTGFIGYYIGVISGLVYLLLPTEEPARFGTVWQVLFGLFCIFGVLGMFAALAKVVTIGGKRPADS